MSEDPRLILLLALADDELIIGHRHSQWTGWAPYLEEDLAFSSIAQDEMAHARLLYALAGEMTGRGEDELALGRLPEDYRNAVLCERPNREWGFSVARQYLYDTADAIRVEALCDSSWPELAEVMNVVRLEERYHLDHAQAWFERLANGPATARQRLADGFSEAMGEALGVFEPLPGEDELVSSGVLLRSNREMLGRWLGQVGDAREAVSLDFVLERHGAPVGEMVPTAAGEFEHGGRELTVPGLVRRDGRWLHEGAFAGAGGRRGRHSEDFAPLWEDLTGLYRAHPGATW